MAELDRSVFNKRIGEIALTLGLISPDAQTRMHEVQARAVVLAQRGAELPTISELNDDAHWLQVQRALGITDEAVNQARAQVMGDAPIAVAGVPPAGAVLAGIPGGIDPIVKDALLAAQASEKALNTLERAKQAGQAFDQTNFDARLQEINNQLDFVHVGRPGEHPLVENAQRVYKTTLQFEALEHHVDCKNNNDQDPEFAKLRLMLASTLPQQVAATYRNAALALGLRAEQLAQENNPAAVQTGAAADALINTLANQLNVAPPTPEEIDALRGAKTHDLNADQVQQGVHTATELNQTSKSFVDAEQAKRAGGQAPHAGVAV